MNKAPEPDILDWEITAAPASDEFPPLELAAFTPPTEPRFRSLPSISLHVTRRIGLVLGSVILTAVLGLGLFWAWNRYSQQRIIQGLIAAEEQAAAGRDIRQLQKLYHPAYADWIKAQARWVIRGHAAPLPLPYLRPADDASVTRSISALAPNVMYAEVVRPFLLPDGRLARFSLTQFYQLTNSEWRRIPPPMSFWGEARVYVSPYVNVTYWQADAALVAELGPKLNAALERACAEWECPPDFKFNLHFTDSAPAAPSYTGSPDPSTIGNGPLLFEIVLATPFQSLTSSLHLPSPQAMGNPADATATEFFKRALTLQVLSQAARHITLKQGGLDQNRNAFFYALIARTAARQGLETPETLAERTLNLVVDADHLWNVDLSFERTQGEREALQGALALTNQLLGGLPSEVEQQLFRALRRGHYATTWLAEGLALSREEFQAYFDTAMERAFQVKGLVTGAYEFALTCQGGPRLFSRGGLSPTPLLAGRIEENYSLSWSPNGQHLGLGVFERFMIVDMDSGVVMWLPTPLPRFQASLNMPTWLSNSVLIYGAWPQFRDSSTPTFHFFDISNPNQDQPSLSYVVYYMPSPHRRLLALGLTDAGTFDRRIAVMPTTGGRLTPIEAGAAPSWSPDSQSLVYVQTHSTGTLKSFRIADLGSGDAHDLLDVDALHVFTPDAQAVWSPTGEQIALVAGPQPALINADGSNLRLLKRRAANFINLAFSTDGQFLATTVSNAGPTSVIVYDAVTGEEIRFMPDVIHFDWSPTGHELAVVADTGLYLLTEPGDEGSALEQLANTPCFSVEWNPGYP